MVLLEAVCCGSVGGCLWFCWRLFVVLLEAVCCGSVGGHLWFGWRLFVVVLLEAVCGSVGGCLLLFCFQGAGVSHWEMVVLGGVSEGIEGIHVAAADSVISN